MELPLPWSELFDEVPVPLSIIDLDGHQLAANRAYRDQFALGDTSLDQLTATNITHPEDRARTQAYLLRLRSGETDELVLDKRYVRVTGEEFIGELRVRSLRGADGEPVALAGAILDVTEARAATARLGGAVERSERASAAKSSFVARVSHDLRTPLHALIGYTELLERLVAGQAAQQLAELIHKQAESLQHLIDDLLDLSAIESGRLDLHLDACAVRPFLQDMLAAVTMAHDTSGLELRAAVADDVPTTIVADERRVREVLTNLVGNAVKYTPRGTIEVIVSRDGALLRFEVSDTGPGIEPSYLATIFDPFRKAGTRLARTAETTGLGLAIVKQLVELMGGTVGVDSEPDVGSTFWFTLPAGVADDATAADPTGPAPETARRQARVLVVDDSATNLELIQQQLIALGQVPVLAPGGREALALLDDTIDLVLMDVNMPDVDGLETTRWIRAAGWRTPVLALTAAAMAADRSACVLAGMDGFLAKPIGLSGLADAIAQWTARTVAVTPTRARSSDGVLDELLRDAGREATIGVARSFLRESERRVTELYEAADRGDSSTFVRQAHTLASTARLVGGADVARLCVDAERAGLAGTDMAHLRPRLEDVYARLRTALIRALTELETAA